MTEFIEMEITSSGSASVNTGLVKKVLKHEYELRAFTDRSISHWWVIVPVLFYLVVIVGGVMTSISVGNVVAAFDDYCLFNAHFTLVDIDSLGNSSKLEARNLQVNPWGNKNDCLFAEYASAACVIFGGIWIVMVLQCGRGGASRRGFRLPDAWRIVPPTCVCNFVYFIISCFVLARVSSGFAGFCENIRFKPDLPSDKNMSCLDVLGLQFFEDKFKTDLVQEYRMSHIGAVVQFVGCLLGFLTVTYRCCTAADFDIYERRQIAYQRANTEETGPIKPYIPDDDEDDECGESDKTFTSTATTVICHNPSIQMDDGDEYGSITSQSELISDPKSSKTKVVK